MQKQHTAVVQHGLPRRAVGGVERDNRVTRVLVHPQVRKGVDDEAQQQRDQSDNFAENRRCPGKAHVLLHHVRFAQQPPGVSSVSLGSTRVQQHHVGAGDGDGEKPDEAQCKPQTHFGDDDQVVNGVAHVQVALQRHAGDGQKTGKNAGGAGEVLKVTPGAELHSPTLHQGVDNGWTDGRSLDKVAENQILQESKSRLPGQILRPTDAEQSESVHDKREESQQQKDAHQCRDQFSVGHDRLKEAAGRVQADFYARLGAVPCIEPVALCLLVCHDKRSVLM